MRPWPGGYGRSLVRVIPALIAAPVLLVMTGAPAAACSCAVQSLQESRDRAEVVFAGEVLRRDAPSNPSSSAEKATYVVRVDRVFKGEAAAVQEVVTLVSGASCGLELPSSGPALLFAGTSAGGLLGLEPGPGQLTANLCGGSQVNPQTPTSLGAGYPPVPLPDPQPESTAANDVGLPAALGLTTVGLAGAVGLVAVRARRRRHG